jgi:hypothetical protein
MGVPGIGELDCEDPSATARRILELTPGPERPPRVATAVSNLTLQVYFTFYQ